jgi:hypothetical protein
MKRSMIAVVITAAIAATVGMTPLYASTYNMEGFETGTGDWVASDSITRVSSGGGALGLTAASGSHYGELTNLHDGYGYTGYGDGGYTYNGGRGDAYNGNFYQSIDVYLNPNWATPASAGEAGLWIDMSCNEHDFVAANGYYRSEHNFRLYESTQGSIAIKADGDSSPMATITEAGWYTFQIDYQKGALATDTVHTNMSILNHLGAVLGTADKLADFMSPMPSSELKGNGYTWITVWQNGYAGDVLGIDNANTGLVPEPGVAALLITAGLSMLAYAWRRRRS